MLAPRLLGAVSLTAGVYSYHNGGALYGVFRQYLSKPSWTRAERKEVFELILATIHENYFLLQGTAPSLERLYAKGACLFNTVSEADYRPPSFF